MMSYKDMTFCASPNCQNECKRQITEEQITEANKLGLMVAYAYFCDMPEDTLKSIKSNEAPE